MMQYAKSCNETMIRLGWILVILLSLTVGSCIAGLPAGLHISPDGSQGVIINFNPQNWQTGSLVTDDKIYTIYTFDDASHYDQVGQPMVPVMTVVIGIPLQGDIRMSLVESHFTEEIASIPPVPTLSQSGVLVEYHYRMNNITYRSPQLFPDSITRLEAPGFFRDQRVVRLHIFPLQYQPLTNTIRKYQHIRLRLHFNDPGKPSSGQKLYYQSEQLYQELIANYDQAKFWRRTESRKLTRSVTGLSPKVWYKIKINKEGIYRITGKVLADHGIDLIQVNPATIKLYNNGGQELPRQPQDTRPDGPVENAIYVFDGNDNHFDFDDYLLFYGVPAEGWQYLPSMQQYRHYRNRYNYDNIYFLSFTDQPGKRMEIAGIPAIEGLSPEPLYNDHLFFEEELLNPISSGMDWVGRSFENERRDQTYQFNLTRVDEQSLATVVFRCAVMSPGMHVFDAFINNHFIGTDTLTGLENCLIFREYQYPSSRALQEGNNEIKISFHPGASYLRAYTDWLEIHYPHKWVASRDELYFNAPRKNGPAHYQVTNFSRPDLLVFDVSDFSNVKQIKPVINRPDTLTFFDLADPDRGKRYLAISAARIPIISTLEKTAIADLHSSRPAEFIIITHDDFWDQAQQLKSLHEDWRTEDRLKTEIVNVKDIYNEFSCGLMDPAAIRDFIRYAFYHWRMGDEAELRYVLLFGDGDFDFKNYTAISDKNWLPPYEASSEYIYDSLVTDDWFVDLDGNQVPEIAVGRLPVQSPSDAKNVLEKIIQYETRPTIGEWCTRITLLADDLISDKSQTEIDHTRDLEKLASHYIPEIFEKHKIYLINYPGESNAGFSGIYKPGANRDLIKSLNEGTLIVNFLGHGNTTLLTHERVLNEPTDFIKIQNSGKLPLLFAGTCDFGLWDDPLNQSFSEKLITAPDRGIIALVSPTRKASTIPNADFDFKLFESLFKDYNQHRIVNTIGEAVLVAKMRQFGSENGQKFVLMGVPTLRIAAPRHQIQFDRVEPDTIMALRKLMIGGKVKKNAQEANDFQGKISLQVFDSEKSRELKYTTRTGEETFNYILPGNTIYRGYATVVDGRFQISLIVPKDISYGGVSGRLGAYAWSPDNLSAVGFRSGLMVGGTAKDINDHDGPDIDIGFQGQDFRDGDFVAANPVVRVIIADTVTGVNITGAIGHSIEMMLDNDASQKKILNDYFRYYENDCYRGELCYPLQALDRGSHTLQIKAWDNANNAASARIQFISIDATECTIRNLINYPNPMVNHTEFTFEWLGPVTEMRLKIYTVAGRLIKIFPAYPTETIGFNIFPESWDGTDQDGDPVANGVYIYRLEAKNAGDGPSRQAEAFGKLVIAR